MVLKLRIFLVQNSKLTTQVYLLSLPPKNLQKDREEKKKTYGGEIEQYWDYKVEKLWREVESLTQF